MRLPAAIAGGVVYPLQERVFHRPTFSNLAELDCCQMVGNGVDAEKSAPIPRDDVWAYAVDSSWDHRVEVLVSTFTSLLKNRNISAD